ncbi:MAG: NHLP leader peptide family RiPP precursor [Vicinamibacterales bacterium]
MTDHDQQPQAMTRHDLETLIVKHCWEDEGFHKEFVADPAACFVKYLNVPRANIPPITVHDEAPGTWHIVIPAKPVAAGELSDEELEKVAGGTDVFVGPSLTVVLTLVTAAYSASATISALGATTVAGSVMMGSMTVAAGWGKK